MTKRLDFFLFTSCIEYIMTKNAPKTDVDDIKYTSLFHSLLNTISDDKQVAQKKTPVHSSKERPSTSKKVTVNTCKKKCH